MTARDGARASGISGLRDLWSRRPWNYSRPLWALTIGLDLLPWPWGEDLLAHLFAAVALVRGSRRRATFAWASQQPDRRAWRLAPAVSAFRGRWVARSALLGIRHPDDLRRQVAVRGEEHLAAAGGAILLGFHLGPPNVDVALRSLGHRVAWLGSARRSRAWSRDAWRPLLDPKDNLCPPDGDRFWPAYLYRARRLLLDGGALFILADSWVGREVFRVPLPGGQPLIIRGGWLNLWRQTGVRVLPVTTHLEGRIQVITIHAPLPTLGPDHANEPSAWLGVLCSLIKDYVRRFPEQCPVLPLSKWYPFDTRARAGPVSDRAACSEQRAP